MIEILGMVELRSGLMKPEHPKMSEMMNGMSEFEKELRRRELNRFLSPSERSAPFVKGRPEARDSRRESFKRGVKSLLKDFDRLIDFLLTRYIVRRETRRARSGTNAL